MTIHLFNKKYNKWLILESEQNHIPNVVAQCLILHSLSFVSNNQSEPIIKKVWICNSCTKKKNYWW